MQEVGNSPRRLTFYRGIMTFARSRKDEFIALVEKTHLHIAESELRSWRVELDKANLRIVELDMITRRLYEDYATGRFTNTRFDNIPASNEAE